MKVAILAITKNGLHIGKELRASFPKWTVFAPEKLSNGDVCTVWYSEPTSEKIAKLFKGYDALVCLFSLGAVIRLVSPHLRDKKSDPAVIVIDDRANFVISALSGHVGGANELAQMIAGPLRAMPVVTTAADVNNTIAVDLVGRGFNWKIEDDSTVTRVSAHMVNEEPIGVVQDAGEKNWYNELPKNVTIYKNMEELNRSNSRACLIISDRILDGVSEDSVVYRPPSLVIGVGLHHDTSKETIREGIDACLEKFKLSAKSVAKIASIKKPKDIQGLVDAGREMGVPVQYVERDELSEISAPNPSETVRAFEGTASVSEAAAIRVSGGELIVEKQKFPPNLTIAVARIKS